MSTATRFGPVQVARHERYGASDYLALDLAVPGVGGTVLPGQFVMLRVAAIGQGPLLPRPFSVLDAEDDRLRLLYKVVGEGTAQLARTPVGATLHWLGPLGTAFPPPPQGGRAVLAGGGFGLAPFRLAARAWADRDSELIVCAGARTAADLPFLDTELVNLPGLDVRVATEDGTRGEWGLVTVLIEDALDGRTGIDTTLHACGPTGMLRAVQAIARDRGIPAWLSLEEHMACGYGVCNGCACTLTETSGDGTRHGKVCVDGPVLPAEQVVFR